MNAFGEQPILVPVDFSDDSTRAVDTALEIAADPAQVHIVHILHEPQSGHPDAIWVAIDHGKRREKTLLELQRLFADMKYRPINVRVEFGDPGMRIVEMAETLKVGLIVMPSHGRSGLKRLLLGSVTERVLRHAHCPVLVLRR